VERNLLRGIAVSLRLLEEGYCVYSPFALSFFSYRKIGLAEPGTARYEGLMQNDIAWVRVCDCVLRLPGFSAGAEREVLAAMQAGIPVFTSLGDLRRWMPVP
jgi:hypothetical protein